MRPVNLIPAESRRGSQAAMRTGALPYLILAALGVALAMVTVLTLTSNGIKDREAEVAALEVQEAEAIARADALGPYAEFASLSQARDLTVTSLAQSRFDWERVLRELALVIPDDVWLTSATGTVSPNTGLESSAVVEGRAAVAGPALEMVGCGTSMDAVAGFVAALRDIDGVTRVGISSSERNERDGRHLGRHRRRVARHLRRLPYPRLHRQVRDRRRLRRGATARPPPPSPRPSARRRLRPPPRRPGKPRPLLKWSPGWRDEVERPHDHARRRGPGPGRRPSGSSSSRRSARKPRLSTTRSPRSRSRSPNRSSWPSTRRPPRPTTGRTTIASWSSARPCRATTTRRA